MDKLRIYVFPNRNFEDSGEGKPAGELAFTVPINPESFTKNYAIALDKRSGHGNQGTDPRYKRTEAEELKLEFILDGTQTMEGYGGEDRDMKTLPVHKQIEKFLGSVYQMDDEIHRPKNFIHHLADVMHVLVRDLHEHASTFRQ